MLDPDVRRLLDIVFRLSAAGVATTLVDCTGMIHGFLRWTGAVPAARRWIEKIAVEARTVMG